MGANLFLELYLDPASAEIFDSFRLELYAGLGVFAGGAVRAGTFQLENAEGLYSSCGACLLLLVDQDLATLKATRTLMPVHGALVLTSVTGRLSGRLEDVELREVTIDLTDPDGPGPLRPTLATSPVPGGCHVHLGRASFDVALDG
jgi:hypothetical protein